MHPDDERLGRLLRLLRRRAELTQEQAAAAAGVPVLDVARIEAGRIEDVRLGRLRRVFRAVGASARLSAWWNGAAADRLLDERHAKLVEQVVQVLKQRGWEVAVELSFSEFGERGSIDVIGARHTFGAVLVIEVKTELGSLEETNRRLDVKERLAPKLALRQFGWRPAHTARLLVLPDEGTTRRVVARHGATMGALYPARSREVRRWLRRPEAPIRGLWFLSDPRNGRPITT